MLLNLFFGARSVLPDLGKVGSSTVFVSGVQYRIGYTFNNVQTGASIHWVLSEETAAGSGVYNNNAESGVAAANATFILTANTYTSGTGKRYFFTAYQTTPNGARSNNVETATFLI